MLRRFPSSILVTLQSLKMHPAPGRAFWTEPASPAFAKIYSPPGSTANTPGLGHEGSQGFFNQFDSDGRPTKPASAAAEISRGTSRLARKQPTLSFVQKFKNATQNRDNQRFAACLWSCGCAGWSDAALGALIPYMETYFSVSSKYSIPSG